MKTMQKEIAELHNKKLLARQRADDFWKRRTLVSDYHTKLMYERESRKYQNQEYKIDEKIAEIRNRGMSTSQWNSIKRESSNGNWRQMGYESSLGARDIVKVGLYKNTPYIVKIVRYNGFMSNVRGMGSLANTSNMQYAKQISQRAYEKQLQGKPRYRQMSFGGHQTYDEYPNWF